MTPREREQNRVSRKLLSVGFAVMIVTSSVAISTITFANSSNHEILKSNTHIAYPTKSCNIASVTTDLGTWISFDSSEPGTPAEAHVTISDTSGITIVADFHGFWRNNYTIADTEYDDLDMPGASSMDETGKPMLPCLFEYLEIPHDVDVSIEVISTCTDNTSEYNIRPAPAPVIPSLVGDSSLNESTDTTIPISFDAIYNSSSYFPGDLTSTEGETNSTSLIMRGHRLLSMIFYPVQYNPQSGNLTAYSQIIIKVKYSSPAQIEPIKENLRSIVFETIIANSILNYDSSNTESNPKTGVPIINLAQIFTPVIIGAEYLIITTQEFKHEADRLAEWKERKGVPTIVWVVDKGAGDQIKQNLEIAYNTWLPAPTYVLLMGDVEFIPACYDARHLTTYYLPINNHLESVGYIASDLGYFNIEGNGYLPDIIYGRMSVDTPEQAGILVNKTLQYEQNPPYKPAFYTNALFAGYFQDLAGGKDGIEDEGFPFIYALERVRYYMKTMYNIHINYSSPCIDWLDLGITMADLKFDDPLYGSNSVSDSISPDYPNFEWIAGYYNDEWPELARAEISPNINAGRFLVLYYDHGGSKNMISLLGKRDYVEGWDNPYYDTSFFSDLTNGNMTPLFINIACSTGWYDGEHDEDYLYYPNGISDYSNKFADLSTECFAEEITRLEGGGAVAAIAASRLSIADASAHLMDGIIQAFWPSYLQSSNQPIYEMGAALVYGKLYVSRDSRLDGFKARTTFEEYNFFGDPETQLWTSNPSNFTVSYPKSIGTSEPQEFVVTVRNKETGIPVNFAKVCIQQDGAIYQVGYTNLQGQVIFNVNPTSSLSHINVTVTKHNYRPYMGSMRVYDSDASILIWPLYGPVHHHVNISRVGFPLTEPVWIYFDNVHVGTIDIGERFEFIEVPSGDSGFVNVWLAVPNGDMIDWNPVAVARFERYSLDEGPDPFIYSQYDASTWDVTGDQFVWDNPDIVVDGNTVSVTVHNRGIDSSIGTKVTLSYSPHLGGLTWYIVDTKTLPSVAGTISFTLTAIPQAECLRVDLFHEKERTQNEINNIGFDCSGIIEMSSPGVGNFLIGNPSCLPRYVTVNVRQLGEYEDVWNATVKEYSSRVLNPGQCESVLLILDSLYNLASNESRLFEVEICINNRCVGGMVFNATKRIPEGINLVTVAIIGGVGLLAVIAIYFSKDRIRTTMSRS